jgi:hypothetical protein
MMRSRGGGLRGIRSLVRVEDGFRRWRGVIMLSVLLRRLGVEMSGVGCVGLSMMISGRGGILLIKEIVLIMLEIEVVWLFFHLSLDLFGQVG